MGVIFSHLFSTPLPVWTPLYGGETENDLLIMTWYVYRDVFYCVICKCNYSDYNSQLSNHYLTCYCYQCPCSIIFLKLEEGSFMKHKPNRRENHIKSNCAALFFFLFISLLPLTSTSMLPLLCSAFMFIFIPYPKCSHSLVHLHPKDTIYIIQSSLSLYLTSELSV